MVLTKKVCRIRIFNLVKPYFEILDKNTQHAKLRNMIF